MAFGHGDLAIHLLHEPLREAPTESPVPWLLLLDLLHREGDTAGHAAGAECRRYLNVNVTDHPVSQEHESGEGLEAYPHPVEPLVKVWNTADIDAFFHDLIYGNRGGTRMGFEPRAYRDILLLRSIAQDTQPPERRLHQTVTIPSCGCRTGGACCLPWTQPNSPARRCRRCARSCASQW